MEVSTMRNTSTIKEKMEVVGSCGNHLGVVDHVEGDSIKLTRNDPNSGGMHHWVPIDWVESVDQHVHLNKNCDAAMKEWSTAPLTSHV
jgi:hypothetical protein